MGSSNKIRLSADSDQTRIGDPGLTVIHLRPAS